MHDQGAQCNDFNVRTDVICTCIVQAILLIAQHH